ncbi:Uncharacterised protein [Shigella sonnei]|nr:Uncharacterised protein [Shigella sonnei]CSF37281.1 Uncharacterised protein [Shigella sonnei]CSF44035.1 Uncharacterised protein [Shigella sonnei]CSF60441.1 Uncharacterised protein [Shigella sonnei]CSG09890.1 Uncharacterised protein [Shigella sonnei]
MVPQLRLAFFLHICHHGGVAVKSDMHSIHLPGNSIQSFGVANDVLHPLNLVERRHIIPQGEQNLFCGYTISLI